MSKLVKKLRQMENAGPSLGFKSVKAQHGRQMLLIACLPDKDGLPMAGLAGLDVDAVVFKVKDVNNLDSLSQATHEAGDMPWGIWGSMAGKDDFKRAKEMGADFLIFDAASTPVELLQDEDLGKLLRLDLSQPEGVIGSADEIDIDMAVVEMDKENRSLTVDDLIKIYWVSDLINKPLLAYSQRELNESELRSLWEAGMKGLVMEVVSKPVSSGPKVLSRVSDAMLGLPAKSKRSAGRGPVVPRITASSEEEEED